MAKSVRSIGVAASILVCLGGSAASAQNADQAYFAGKTLRLIVGYGAGGGYDAYARMLAPFFAKKLHATVIVENQPGAGGLVALNRVYASPPDGLTMMIVNGTGAAVSQITEQQGARFDLGKLGYVATVSASPWMWLVGPNSKITTPQEAIKANKVWRWAGSGPADGLSDGAAFTCAALRLKCHVVIGYKGSHQAALAVTQGEMDAIYVSDTSANHYVHSKQNLAIATMGRKKSRFFPDRPTIFEAVKLDADQQWLFDFRAALENLGRILVVPPGMQASRLAYLQDVVKQVLTDSTVTAMGEKSQRYIDYLDPKTTRDNALTVVAKTTPEQRNRIKGILTNAITRR